MEVKPPVAIALVAVLIVLLVGGFMMYDRSRKAALNPDEQPTKAQYMPPGGTAAGTGQ